MFVTGPIGRAKLARLVGLLSLRPNYGFQIVFDRPDLGDQAVLVCLDFGDADYQENIAECAELVKSAGVEVMGIVQGKRQRPDAALFAGKGKVEEVGLLVRATDANVVIFNHALAPGQERNLERALQCRVIDRNSLILDIFAQRAQPRRQAASRTGAAIAYVHPSGTRLDSPGATEGWYRPARSRRNPA